MASGYPKCRMVPGPFPTATGEVEGGFDEGRLTPRPSTLLTERSPALRVSHPSCSCRTSRDRRRCDRDPRCSRDRTARHQAVVDTCDYVDGERPTMRRLRPRCVEALLRMANQEQASPGINRLVCNAQNTGISSSRPASRRGDTYLSIRKRIRETFNAGDDNRWDGEDSTTYRRSRQRRDRQGAFLREGRAPL